MFIVVHHSINNPPLFWGAAKKNLVLLPEGGVQRVLNVFPNENMDHCTCLWEADSITTLDNYLRDKLGDASRETYYTVNEANAVGLPLAPDGIRK